jgi:hypothetical protein
MNVDTLPEDALTGPIEAMERPALLQLVAYYQAQDGLLSQAQEKIARLQGEIAEIERPLDAQMARLNARVIALTAQRDVLSEALGKEVARLDWIERLAKAGRLEIAISILGSGFEFGMHATKKPTRCTVKNGTLRTAVDAAREEFQ